MKTKKIWVVVFLIFFFQVVGSMTAFSGPVLEQYTLDGMWPYTLRPWSFNTPGCIKVDSKGDVYVADTLNHRIQKFSSTGHLVKEWGTRGDEDGQFESPMGIALDADGFVYVADTYNSRIQKFTLDGDYITQWQCPDTGPGFPIRLAVRANGDVFACITGYKAANDEIEVFKEDNGVYSLLYNFAGGPGNQDGEFQFMQGEVFGGDIEIRQECEIVEEIIPGAGTKIDRVCTEFLFLADTWNYRVQKFRLANMPKGEHLTSWGDKGSGQGEFGGSGKRGPTDIAIDKEGQVYILDPDNTRIQVFNLIPDNSGDYEFNRKWGDDPNEFGKFSEPESIAMDSFDRVYVTDSESYSIQKFFNTGELIERWSDSSLLPGAYKLPEGICFDGTGRLFVADTGNHRIQILDSGMNQVEEWNRSGSTQSAPWFPKDITISSTKKVYICGDDVVQIFDLSKGQFEDEWKGFDDPQGIAVDSKNDVYVADAGNNLIRKFKPDGNEVAQWKDDGKGGVFLNPTSLTLDSSDNMYICDAGNFRVVAIKPDGSPIGSWGSEGSGNGQFLSGMKGIMIDSSGYVYVTDSSNHRIQTFAPDGQYLGQLGEYGHLPGDFNNPKSIKMGADGKIYLADTNNQRIQRFTLSSQQDNNKAIILAGGGNGSENTLWRSTKVATDLAAWVLRFQGYPAKNIQYLTAETSNNPYSRSLIPSNKANLIETISNWASDATGLTLYFADHGGDGTFQINSEEILEADELGGLISNLQSRTGMELTVIIDACYSGSFLNALAVGSDIKRIVITSSEADEIALFSGQGWHSFSSAFWLKVFSGISVGKAFNGAVDQLLLTSPKQNPTLIVNNLDPGQVFIGNGFTTHDIPEIRHATVGGLTGNTATLTAGDIGSRHGISKVWAVVAPETGEDASRQGIPIMDYPRVDMSPYGSIGSWSGKFSRFDYNGKYNIWFYAMDMSGATSSPKLIKDSKSPMEERKAMIILGGDTQHPDWDAFKSNAQLVYQALRWQGYYDGDIEFLSPQQFTGVDGTADLSAIQGHLVTLNREGETKDLVLYMIGPSENNFFQVHNGVWMTPENLSDWLEGLKSAVIYDADFSGSFIDKLSNPNRIIITSTSVLGQANFLFEGAFSFSRSFWNQVLNGVSVLESYNFAQNELRLASTPPQSPELDDDGDGYCCGFGDGSKAREFIIGTGVKMAANDPLVAPEDYAITGQDGIIWLEDVATTDAIVEVRALVSSPGYGDLPAPVLTKALNYKSAKKRWEITWKNFFDYGRYNISFIVKTHRASRYRVSPVIQKTILRRDGIDIFEPDDDAASANVIPVDGKVQEHNFHQAKDADWVKFLALADNRYEISAIAVGVNSEPKITLFEPDKKSEIGDPQEGGTLTWDCTVKGEYYVMIQNGSSEIGVDTGYDLSIIRPDADPEGILEGFVYDSNWAGITGAEVKVTYGSTSDVFPRTHTSGYFSMSNLITGNWQVKVTKDGYTHDAVEIGISKNTPFQILKVNSLQQALKGDIDGDGDVDTDDRDLVVAVIQGLNPEGIRREYWTSGADVNGDLRIGPEELIYIQGIIQ